MSVQKRYNVEIRVVETVITSSDKTDRYMSNGAPVTPPIKDNNTVTHINQTADSKIEAITMAMALLSTVRGPVVTDEMLKGTS